MVPYLSSSTLTTVVVVTVSCCRRGRYSGRRRLRTRTNRPPSCRCRGQTNSPSPRSIQAPMKEANCSPAAGVWSSAPTTCRRSWRSPSASLTAACSPRPATPCAAGSVTTLGTGTWSRPAGARYRVPQPRLAGAPAAPHPAGNHTPEQEVRWLPRG